MSRYFFTPWTAPVNTGITTALSFDSLQDAGAHAAKIAAERAQDGDQYRGFEVSVPDDHDRELERVTVKLTDAS